MCKLGVETIDHILLSCCYSQEVWHCWLVRLQLSGAAPINGDLAIPWWLVAARQKALTKNA